MIIDLVKLPININYYKCASCQKEGGRADILNIPILCDKQVTAVERGTSHASPLDGERWASHSVTPYYEQLDSLGEF